MDWMTMTIVVVGVAIFCVWVIIPIQEYRSIYLRLRRRRPESKDRDEPPNGPFILDNPPTEDPRENRA